MYLRLAMSRGAAYICADNEDNMAIIIPILFGTVLVQEKVSAIMVQVMNNRRFTTKVERYLFDLMNPYRCGVFDSKVKAPPPVIRMFFALASPESSVTIPSQRLTPNTGVGRYTAYDIWCAGARGSTFAVVQEDEEDVLARLLETLREHREVAKLYEDPWHPESESTVHAIRTMSPGTSTHRSYFEQWFDLEDSDEEIELAEPESE
ncbi:uncharacterized protein B0H18DRAFT_1211012 [Fomitopsis serialis]|uniref:uncharacterized protein n=1 Tax=Fomitopsis serialis TaxID=139415 RepID=UPI00200747BF|nr:uncharacterized protein B0H18DRAFT_1211012 [Neoantrodia serialis]KAH9926371.1 hypothetical protein B0H18DRAFT_1211012 [Neoantrodia serialis]